IERATIFHHDGIIEKDILSQEILENEQSHEDLFIDKGVGLNEIKKQAIEKLEMRIIIEGLQRTNWNKTECAKLLKVSRGDLMRKIARYKITTPK
ncbi:MAG: hypothetical protein KKH94_12835, partial [Candidatus Omnitrophica bacterium]|nr:hypothetical protein [Candidatus Omnitrophota bacterium]